MNVQHTAATKCFVFDLDDVLLPTTYIFQQPHIRQRLSQLYSSSDSIARAYQSFIHPDMQLIHLLHQLRGLKFLITNASQRHAQASMEALCIAHYFQAQLNANSNLPLKPNPHMYQAMHNHIVRGLANQPAQIFFFDDRIENLIEPRLLHWNTVWIFGTTPQRSHNTSRQNLPSFVNYAFPTVHEALRYFNSI